ncbi:hypothetical protein [Embleya scabrispora]|nr:hypothetical protein [Embleya scabrispora]
MREQEEDAARRRAEALRPMWPVMAMGQYDRNGTAVPVPSPRRPVTEEARVRHVGRRPHVVFHADALNSPFFAKVPLEERCEALTRVLDVLLRRPSEGKVSIGPGSITVSGRKVTLTLTPDCAMVRTLNPPRKGDKNIPPLYRAARWPVDRPRPPRRDRSNAESPTDTETPYGGDRFATIDE